MKDLLEVATSQLGVAEIKGQENNPIVVNYATETGINGVSDDETAWCSTFVSWCAKQAGLPYSRTPNARSWMAFGQSTTAPEPGDVVVFWRESRESWKGHVGFYLGHSSDLERIYCLGGNQGNKVSVSAYGADKLLGFRRLTRSFVNAIPKPILKNGSSGAEVVKLQDALKQLDYNVGTSDGAFGPKTTAQLKQFQANNRLTVDGIYGTGSQTMLITLLQQ